MMASKKITPVLIAVLTFFSCTIINNQLLKAEDNFTVIKKFSPSDASVVIYKHTPEPPNHPSDKVSGTLIMYKGKPHILTDQHVLPPTQIKTSDGDYVIFSIGPEESGKTKKNHI